MESLQKHWRTISKDEINQLPIIRYEGPVEIVDSEASADNALQAIQQEKVLGFDTETRPSFRKGQSYRVSLLQLATAAEVYIFQLQKWLPEKLLLQILQDPDIVKAGVAVADDIKELQQLVAFEPAAFVDLGVEARHLGLKTHGLRSLTANFLHSRISKSAQRSNWARRELTAKQVTYAATDAWIGRELYLHMHKLELLNKKRSEEANP